MKVLPPAVQVRPKKNHRTLFIAIAVAVGVGLILLAASICMLKLSWTTSHEMRSTMEEFRANMAAVQHLSQMGRSSAHENLQMPPHVSKNDVLKSLDTADGVRLMMALRHLHLNVTNLRGIVSRARNRSNHRDVILTYLLSKQKELRNTVMGFLCAPPYVRIHPAVCIHVNQDGKTWANARGQCKKEGGDLMSIRAASETKALVRFLHPLNMEWIWIGLYGQAHLKKFIWSVDGRAPTYTNWQPREPGHSGNCVNLNSRDGRWDNDLCGARLPFICQKHFYEL